jgi:predicted component of type VI protein secretion system
MASSDAVLDTAVDVKVRIEAERTGMPFVYLRDGDGVQRIVALDPAREVLVVGRDEKSDVCLSWDDRVSALHARLERAGRFWTLRDDGLSRNGSFVNGERVHGDRRLRDGDELRLGGTRMIYRSPTPHGRRRRGSPARRRPSRRSHQPNERCWSRSAAPTRAVPRSSARRATRRSPTSSC